MPAGVVSVENVPSTATAIAAVWDDIGKQLPIRAQTLNIPVPTLTDMTLSKAMASSDLRMQLVTWSNRYAFGRAWIDDLDDLPRPVWVTDEKPSPNGVKLTLIVAIPDVSPASPAKEIACPFEVTLIANAGKVSGNYSTAGVSTESLPVPSANGVLQGTQTPLAGGARQQPRLAVPKVTGTAQDMNDARKYLFGANLILRLFRSMDILLTQAVDPTNAWDAGRCMTPEFPAGKAAVKPKPVTTRASRKGGSAASVDDLLDKEMVTDGAMGVESAVSAKPDGKAPADPEAKVKVAVIASLLSRMRASATAWVASLPTVRTVPAGSEESAADPDFGPWFGAGFLTTNAVQNNLLPDDAEASGSQRWLFVRNWQFVGPFPASQPDVVSWNLSEFFDATNAPYATDREGLKLNGETYMPETPYVYWQRVGEQIEEGLQRPPVWRGVTDDNDSTDDSRVLTSAGPWNGYSYARTEIHSPKDVDLWVGIGADDQGRLWVNDRLVTATAGLSDDPERIAWGKASFRKGVNTVLVRCDNVTADKRIARHCPPSAVLNYFWVKVAVHGRPLGAVAAKERQAAVEKKRAEILNLPANVAGFRNNNTANYPDAKPVTAWDICNGQNVIWRAHLECEPRGRQYEPRGPNSKAPPVVVGDLVVVLGEPHFITGLDRTTGKVLWERECNVLEFTAPDKLTEARRIWSEHVKARKHLFSLDRDWDARRDRLKKQGNRSHPPAHFNNWAEWVEVLLEQGMSKEEALAEIERRITAMNENCFDLKRRKGKYEKIMKENGKYAPSGWGSWTGYSFGSPVTDGEKVWVKFCTGVAACFDREGNRAWMSQIPADINGYPVCCSPLLVDGKFIVEVGAGSIHIDAMSTLREGCDYTMLVALDAATGKELWRSERLFQRAQTSSSVAMRATNGRDDEAVIVTGGGAVIRAADGKTLHQTWMLDSGAGTPTVNGADIYYSSGQNILAASRLTMNDRDSIGLRRLWTRPMPCDFDGGIVYDKGLIYGPGGGQRSLGYVVFDAVNRRVARHETSRDVRQGIPPWVNGRQYVPAIAAGDYLFLGEHGSNFDGPSHDGAICAVMQKGADGMILAQNEIEETWTAPPVFDGDRMYIRTDPSLICVGYTGDDGKAYEADVNARYLLPELEVLPPDDTPPIPIAPVAVPLVRPPGAYARYLTYPMTTIGPFSLENSDAVLTAMGGAEKASEGICREPEKPHAAGVREPIEVAGERVEGSWHEACVYENHSTKRLRGLVGKGAFLTTVIANDRERVVRVWAQQEPPDIWINAQPIPEGTRVRLKPGNYTLLARWASTKESPAAPGFHFRLDDSSDVAAERKAWLDSLRRCKPELERIAKYGTHKTQVEKAKKLLAVLSAGT